jgi:hypothetical protein
MSPSAPSSLAEPHRELWSQPFLDEVAAEHFRLIAQRMETEPQIVALALDNIRRWIARDVYHSGELSTMNEWRDLLIGSRSRLRQVMLDQNQDACRLRQSSPFAGVLSAEEREDVLSRVEARWLQESRAA